MTCAWACACACAWAWACCLGLCVPACACAMGLCMRMPLHTRSDPLPPLPSPSNISPYTWHHPCIPIAFMLVTALLRVSCTYESFPLAYDNHSHYISMCYLLLLVTLLATIGNTIVTYACKLLYSPVLNASPTLAIGIGTTLFLFRYVL